MTVLFGPMFRTRTYVVALFLASRWIVGTLYFTILLTGVVAGLSGALAIVGIPMIVATLAIGWAFAAFERQTARWWLGADVPPMSPPRRPNRSLPARVRDHLANWVTWKSLLYLFLQFPAGLIVLPLEIAGLAVALAATLAPVWYLLDRLTYHATDVAFSGPAIWAFGTSPGLDLRGMVVAVALCVAGFVLLAWVLYVIDATGRGWAMAATRLLGISQTDARLAEARLIAVSERERAERADQSRRELIVNMSHELRTPIASIRAHVESLSMREGGPPLDPETTRYLEIIERETERLSALVDDLLAVARAEAGELRLTIGPVSVTQVVRHVHEALGPIARRQRRVTLVERLPEAGLPPVQADADRLVQVMLNLVRNAVTYTPEGGLVSIEGTTDGPGHVALVVADTGMGIAEQDLPRVFDRFYRTDQSRARTSGGFGLGLSIAKDLVQAMGGTISVESAVGIGTRFTVRLPTALPMEVR